MHVKTIKGRKYYYKSIRKGDKVTSEYIGPVDAVDSQKQEPPAEPKDEDPKEKSPGQEEEEDDYIG